MPIPSIKNGAHYLWGDACDGWHLASSEALSGIQEGVPPGRSEVRHLHNKAEQFFYILAGFATLEVPVVFHTVNEGEGFHVPARVAHTLSNTHEDDLNFLVVSTPPSHGDRVNV